jgi:exopolyphosphatase/guanosine-5'-triphosphate,3'-diphosphate pyrophosphatase
MPVADRARHPCIGADRADLVVAGCAILEAIYRVWPAPHLRVADRGVREGLLMGLMQQADADAYARGRYSVESRI